MRLFLPQAMTASSNVIELVLRSALAIAWGGAWLLKIIPIATDPWFIWDVQTAVAILIEPIVALSIAIRRSSPWGLLASLCFLSAAIVYHLVRAYHIPNGSCGCLGDLRASHQQMLMVCAAGAALSALALGLRPQDRAA